MIKSDEGTVEISCKGVAMLMVEFTSICKAIDKTLENSDIDKKSVNEWLNHAVKLAFMTDEEIDAEAEEMVKDIKPNSSIARLIKELEEEEEDGRKAN